MVGEKVDVILLYFYYNIRDSRYKAFNTGFEQTYMTTTGSNSPKKLYSTVRAYLYSNLIVPGINNRWRSVAVCRSVFLLKKKMNG